MENDKINHCIICLGSNHQADVYFAKAIQLLAETYPKGEISPIEETEPIGDFDQGVMFFNAVAHFYTWACEEDVLKTLKQIEILLDRNPNTPKCVTIDLDLIYWNGEPRKPSDLSRTYVRKGISQLGVRIDEME